MTDDPRIGALADAVRDLRRDLDSLTAVVEKTAAAHARNLDVSAWVRTEILARARRVTEPKPGVKPKPQSPGNES